MKIQLVRSATLKMDYAGQRFLMDPYLAARHTRPTYAGKSLNPLVELPCSPQEVLAGVEWVLLSHLHSDHFDPAAEALLPRTWPILCQPADQAELTARGFQNITPVENVLDWRGIKIERTPCQHGSGAVLDEMGEAAGFIFSAEGEPTVYWAGDTIWNDTLADLVARRRPQIIITHSCGAVWGDQVLILMDAAQTAAVCQAAPSSTVIAVHMEAVDHATVTRRDLRQYATAAGIGEDRLFIPADGETLTF